MAPDAGLAPAPITISLIRIQIQDDADSAHGGLGLHLLHDEIVTLQASREASHPGLGKFHHQLGFARGLDGKDPGLGGPVQNDGQQGGFPDLAQAQTPHLHLGSAPAS